MSKAFTLIELLVVIGIILILTSILLPNYRSGQKQLTLLRAAHKVAQDLRRGEALAMSAEKINGTPLRYGLEFDVDTPGAYILFADINGNGKREPSDQIIETVNIEEGASIQQLFIDTPPSSKDQIWITFEPPEPIVNIRGPASGDFPPAQIRITSGEQTKMVNINKIGLIYVQ